MRFIILFICLLFSQPLLADPQELKNQLEKIENEVRALPKYSPLEQQHVVLIIVNFFQTTAATHAKREAKDLFPALEKTKPNLTTQAAYEQQIMSRWTSDLNILASSPTLDVDKFVSCAYQLIGLLKASLEVEETLFSPQ